MRSSKAYGWNPTRNQTFRSPLHSWGGSVTDCECDINALDKDKWTVLMLASVRNHENIVRLLVGCRTACDINAKSEGKNALARTLERGCPSLGSFLAQTMIPHLEIPYSDVPVSWFVPQRSNMSVGKYAEYKAIVALLCMDRAIKDPEFGRAMQEDIKEILGGKTESSRSPLTNEDKVLLIKLVKTLRSIDYTDQVGQESDGGNDPSAYDMEL